VFRLHCLVRRKLPGLAEGSHEIVGYVAPAKIPSRALAEYDGVIVQT